jgi:hypothetical protein
MHNRCGGRSPKARVATAKDLIQLIVEDARARLEEKVRFLAGIDWLLLNRLSITWLIALSTNPVEIRLPAL